VVTYRNGTPLIDASNYTNEQWFALTEGAWCYPNNQINYDDSGDEILYGKLYNSYAVNDTSNGGLAPDGLRIPTETEWNNLITSLGGESSGIKMCAEGNLYWVENYLFKPTDETGLTILPAGNRSINEEIGFINYTDTFKYSASFWAAKKINGDNDTFTINSYNNKILINNYSPNKSNGMSVRCIVDDYSTLPPTPTPFLLNCEEYGLDTGYYSGNKAIKTNESSSIWLLYYGRKYGFISWVAWKAYGLDNSPLGGDNYTNTNNWTIVSVEEVNSVPYGGFVDENGVINEYEERDGTRNDDGCYFNYRNCDGMFVTVFVPNGSNTNVFCYPNTSPILSYCTLPSYSEIYIASIGKPTPTPTKTPTPTPTPTTTINPFCSLGEITIGSQIWGACNLNVSTYSDGTPIPEVTNPSDWSGLTTGAWCYSNNSITNGLTYNKLYNWYAVAGIWDEESKTNVNQRKKLAPTGYHVPTDTEWVTLTTFLGT
jgi:uncharacterized protein (TIGR02145 family)